MRLLVVQDGTMMEVDMAGGFIEEPLYKEI